MIAKPAIIIIHTMVAAAARRSGDTRFAMRTRSEVPHALTPQPISANEITAKLIPKARCVDIIAVAVAAPVPPNASAIIPPMIQGVRLCPTSDP